MNFEGDYKIGRQQAVQILGAIENLSRIRKNSQYEKGITNKNTSLAQMLFIVLLAYLLILIVYPVSSKHRKEAQTKQVTVNSVESKKK